MEFLNLDVALSLKSYASRREDFITEMYKDSEFVKTHGFFTLESFCISTINELVEDEFKKFPIK